MKMIPIDNFLGTISSNRGINETITTIAEVTNFFMDHSPKNKNFLDDLFRVCTFFLLSLFNFSGSDTFLASSIKFLKNQERGCMNSDFVINLV